MHLYLCCAESECHRSNNEDLYTTYYAVLVNTIWHSGLVGVFIQRTGFVFYKFNINMIDSHYYCSVIGLPVLVVTRVFISSYLKLSVCSEVTFTLAPVTQFGNVLTILIG